MIQLIFEVKLVWIVSNSQKSSCCEWDTKTFSLSKSLGKEKKVEMMMVFIAKCCMKRSVSAHSLKEFSYYTQVYFANKDWIRLGKSEKRESKSKFN